MIARISKGSDVNGMVFYNHNKTTKKLKTNQQEKEPIMEGRFLGSSNIFLTHNTPHLHRRIIDTIQVYNNNNINRSKPNLHISLNFHKNDILSDKDMMDIANDYLKEMKLSNQPYAVYRHFDKEHPHMHIVTTRIDKNGHYISDSNDQYKSVKAAEKIEIKYGLTIAKDAPYREIKNLEKSINNYYNGREALFPIINKAIKVSLKEKPTSYKELEKELLHYNIVRREVTHQNKKGHCFYLLTPEEIPKFKEDKTYHIEHKYANGSDLEDDYNYNFMFSILEHNKKEKKENLKPVMGRFYSVINLIKEPILLSELQLNLQKKGLLLEVYRKQTGPSIGEIYGASLKNTANNIDYKLSELKLSWSKLSKLIIDDKGEIKSIDTKQKVDTSDNIENSKEPSFNKAHSVLDSISNDNQDFEIDKESLDKTISVLNYQEDELGITDSIKKKKKKKKKRKR